MVEVKIKIKEVTAGYKGSENYNSGEIRFTAEVDGDIDFDMVASKLYDRAKAVVDKKLGTTEEAPKTEDTPKKEESNEWKQCECGKNCKKGFMKDHPDSFFCGTCKKEFD